MTKENPHSQAATGTQRPGEASIGLARIREAARRDKTLRLTALLHHVTPAALEESYRALSPDAAPGVDEVTWREYGGGGGLAERLCALHARVQSGTYKALPSKRIYIPKADGRLRPIGIAALEDKIVQHVVARVMGAIWEVDFVGFSYGFRPRRSQHNALDALYVAIDRGRVNWVLDADIKGFFDNLDHGWLMKFVAHRIGDERVLRLIGNWLRAGVAEDGEWSRTEKGTPQGAVISPLLANIYLHYALDLWVQWWRKNKARGEVYIVRYADDFVMGFEHWEDAQSLLAQMRARMGKFGLELHPEKTRLIEFGRFAAEDRRRRGEGKPETFDFLGFTHICGITRNGKRFSLFRRTVAKRLQAKAREVAETLGRMRHKSIAEMGTWLGSVLRGYYNYHAVHGNLLRLQGFRRLLARVWQATLRRRSQRGRKTTWEHMIVLMEQWLPEPRILHPYPSQRLRVSHPR